MTVPGDVFKPVIGGLDQCAALTEQVLEEFRFGFAAQRPQAGARAAGGNHRVEILELLDVVGVVRLGLRNPVRLTMRMTVFCARVDCAAHGSIVAQACGAPRATPQGQGLSFDGQPAGR